LGEENSGLLQKKRKEKKKSKRAEKKRERGPSINNHGIFNEKLPKR